MVTSHSKHSLALSRLKLILKYLKINSDFTEGTLGLLTDTSSLMWFKELNCSLLPESQETCNMQFLNVTRWYNKPLLTNEVFHMTELHRPGGRERGNGEEGGGGGIFYTAGALCLHC
jgi:hypothetical protein